MIITGSVAKRRVEGRGCVLDGGTMKRVEDGGKLSMPLSRVRETMGSGIGEVVYHENSSWLVYDDH